MNDSYFIFMTVVPAIVIVVQGLFLLQWRPGWDELRMWWVNLAIYAQSIALFSFAIRTLVLYLSRIYPPNDSGFHQFITTLAANRGFLIFLSFLFVLGSVIHYVAFLVNRHRDNA